jgi:hypothetical protein
LGQIALANLHSDESAQRCTQTDPSAAVSVLMHTPWSGQSALVAQATVQRPICRPVSRLLKSTQRGVASAQAAEAWHDPYGVSLRELQATRSIKTTSDRGSIGSAAEGTPMRRAVGWFAR